MATATLPKNKNRVFKKIMSVLYGNSMGMEADKPVGHAHAGNIIRRVWVCAGAPSGAIPTGMLAGDLILDTTNDEVYKFITGTTYHQMKA